MSGGVQAATPKNVKELIAAWQQSGRQALHLRRKLKEVAQHAQRYRRDLLFLAQQNQLRKQQADDLRARLLDVLERQQGTPEEAPEALVLPPDQETVPSQMVHKLLKRLRDSQAILAEYDTLLQFREKQVQELLASATEEQSGVAQDFLVTQLRQQLSQARHRVRLLTKELSQVHPPSPATASSREVQEYAARVKQLEELLAAGGLAENSAQISEYEERIRQLESMVAQGGDSAALRDGVTKLQSALDLSQKRVKELEGRPASSNSEDELLEEIAALQDEVGRLQEDVSLLQKENEELHAQSSPDAMQQVTGKLNELHQALEEERAKRTQLEGMVGEVSVLRQENAALKSGAGDSQRAEKLEAAVGDLRAKLQLAASKYQEVKQALLDKHRELNELKSKTQENEKRSEVLVPVVQTLESALNEARGDAEKVRAELAAEKQKRLEAEKKLAAGDSAPAASEAGDSSGSPDDLASMETKLKEARRSAVRAQAEAGVKRKEAAKLQEELNTCKAALAAAETKLKQAGIA